MAFLSKIRNDLYIGGTYSLLELIDAQIEFYIYGNSTYYEGFSIIQKQDINYGYSVLDTKNPGEAAWPIDAWIYKIYGSPDADDTPPGWPINDYYTGRITVDLDAPSQIQLSGYNYLSTHPITGDDFYSMHYSFAWSFKFDVVSGIFDNTNNNVDFDTLDSTQIDLLLDDAPRYIAMGGNDKVTLPSVTNQYGKDDAAVPGGWDQQKKFDGGWGKDTIEGRDRDDIIDGGPGNDILIGGPGNDTFYGVKRQASNPDENEITFGDDYDTIIYPHSFINYKKVLTGWNFWQNQKFFYGIKGINTADNFIDDPEILIFGGKDGIVYELGDIQGVALIGAYYEIQEHIKPNDPWWNFISSVMKSVVEIGFSKGDDIGKAFLNMSLQLLFDVSFGTLVDKVAPNLTVPQRIMLEEFKDNFKLKLTHVASDLYDYAKPYVIIGDDSFMGTFINKYFLDQPEESKNFEAIDPTPPSYDLPPNLPVTPPGGGTDGNDTIDDRANVDFSNLDGGLGDDVMMCSTLKGGVAFGGKGDDKLIGGGAVVPPPPALVAAAVNTSPRNFLFGEAGNDSLVGGDGDDFLDGGDGVDTAVGGAGDDVYFVDSGADRIVELIGGGNDMVIAETMVFILPDNVEQLNFNGSGDFYGRGNAEDNVIRGGDGADTLLGLGGRDTLIGLAGADLLQGGNWNDELWGDDGSDTLVGGRGADTLDGGADTDTATYLSSPGGVTVDLPNGTGSGYDAEGDVLSNIENLIGSDFGDVLKGNSANNVLKGQGGDDSVLGGGGSDMIYGGSGADTLRGGAGADTLIGNAGGDLIDGGGGMDTADYTAAQGAINVDLWTGIGLGSGAQGDTVVAVENLIGTRYSDTLAGASGGGRLVGGNGGDLLTGALAFDVLDGYDTGGDDTLLGGRGNDTLNGGEGNDLLKGGAGNDVLIKEHQSWLYSYLSTLDGGSGNDTITVYGQSQTYEIFAGSGNDYVEANALGSIANIRGGLGSDTLIGGASWERFIYSSVSESPTGATSRDRIELFDVSYDRIDLSAIDADGDVTNGDTAFVFVTNGFTGAGAELVLQTINNNGNFETLISGDVNGDKIADFEIIFDMYSNPLESAFIL